MTLSFFLIPVVPDCTNSSGWDGETVEGGLNQRQNCMRQAACGQVSFFSFLKYALGVRQLSLK